MTTREKSFIHELVKLLERYGVKIVDEGESYQDNDLMIVGKDIRLPIYVVVDDE